MDALSGTDQKIGSELVREDEGFIDIVEEFLNGIDERLQIMERAISTNDFEALRVAAHQLKGSGGGYGYPIVTERAAELEKLAREGAVDDCRESLDQLSTLCARLAVSTN